MSAPAAATTSRTGWFARSGIRVLLTTACTVVAVLASARALTTVILPGPWVGTATRMVLLLAVVTAGYRLAQHQRADVDEVPLPAGLQPTALGAFVGAWALLGRYGGVSEGFSVIIGTANVGRLGDRLTAAQQIIADGVAPIDAALPIEMMAVGGVMIVFLCADLVAGGLRIPTAVGPFLITLWLPALVLEKRVPAGAFALTVAALLVMLAVDNPQRIVRRPANARRGALAGGGPRAWAGAWPGVAVVVCAVTAGAVVVAGGAGGLPQAIGSSWSNLFRTTGGSVRLSPDLDLRRDLEERSGLVMLEYASSGANVGPLRSFTLTSFDGTRWRPPAERSGRRVAADDVLWPTRDAGNTGATLRVGVGALSDTRLPIPTEPRAIDIRGTWSYNDDVDQVVGTKSTVRGQTYTVVVHPRGLDAAQLRGATGNDPDGQALTAVPRTSHTEEIRALARQVLGGATNRYDQALALQTYFRDTSRFTYSTDVSGGSTDDLVWDFLQRRTGYCIHFATAMTVLARALGIPARLGVGFLPGSNVGNGRYEITGRHSHAWPELYFPESGWVRFEPTPAQQSGLTPAWATPSTGPTTSPEVPSQVPSRRPAEGADPEAPNASATSAPATIAGAGSAQPWLVVGLSTLVVLALLGLGTLLAMRRRRPAVREAGTEAVWSELAQRLGTLGIGWPASATPRRVRTLVLAQVRHRAGAEHDRDLTRALEQSLDILVDAVESYRYRPGPTPADVTTLRTAVDAAVGAASTAVGGTADGSPGRGPGFDAVDDSAISDRPVPVGGPSAPRAG